MNKTLIYMPEAGKAFLRLPDAVQESFTRKLLLYGLTGQGDVKRMVGQDALRLRDGDYRVIFEETTTSLTIVGVGHRGQVYR